MWLLVSGGMEKEKKSLFQGKFDKNAAEMGFLNKIKMHFSCGKNNILDFRWQNYQKYSWECPCTFFCETGQF